MVASRGSFSIGTRGRRDSGNESLTTISFDHSIPLTGSELSIEGSNGRVGDRCSLRLLTVSSSLNPDDSLTISMTRSINSITWYCHQRDQITDHTFARWTILSAQHRSGVAGLTSIRISDKHRITLGEFRIRSPLASCAWPVVSPVFVDTHLPKHNACRRSYVCRQLFPAKGIETHNDLPPDLPPLDNLIL
jgi:hypothetical protein